jgi:hypothetical protein
VPKSLDLKNSQSIFHFKACAIGSALAGLFLIFMTFVPQDYTREDQVAIWSGSLILNSQEFLAYSRQFFLKYTLLSIYLIGHFLMWLGYGCIISKRDTAALVGKWIISIGFFSCFSDLSEYCIRGTMIKSVEWGINSGQTAPIVWWFVRELSIWWIYLGTIIIGFSFFNRSILSAVILIFSLIGILTIPCSYLFNFTKIWFAWLVTWHFISALAIWWGGYCTEEQNMCQCKSI